jgi:hypothetical protein
MSDQQLQSVVSRTVQLSASQLKATRDLNLQALGRAEILYSKERGFHLEYFDSDKKNNTITQIITASQEIKYWTSCDSILRFISKRTPDVSDIKIKLST